MGTISQITVGGVTHYIASTAYCRCTTPTTTAAKVAKLVGDQDNSAETAEFTLIKGVTVHVYFQYYNSISNPTLNVAGTGAKAIKRYGTTAAGKDGKSSWVSGAIVTFTYDGTYWVMNSGWNNDTTYSNQTALQDSTTLCLATRGQKYTWNDGITGAYESVAKRESGSSATMNYEAEDHLFYNDHIYRVAQPIASGADLATQEQNDKMYMTRLGDELTDCSRVIETQTFSVNPRYAIINWRYRMFTNGYIEGFGHVTETFTHYYQFGTVYGYYCNVPLPEQFGDTGVVAEVSWNIGSAFGASAGVKGNRTTEIQVYGISNASGSQICHIFIHIQGRKAQ